MHLNGELCKAATETRNATAAISSGVLIEGDLTLILPLRYTGGDLGLGSRGEPWIHFIDANGKRFLSHSAEWLLENINSFAEGRDRDQPLACAALHYGLDIRALLGRNQLCNVRKLSGEILLTEVSYEAALWAQEEYMRRPEWTASLHIQFLGRFDLSTSSSRRDGPLVLLHHESNISDSKAVVIRSHIGRAIMAFEEALCQIDQFSHAHQAELLTNLTNHYEIDEARSRTAVATRRALTPVRRARLLKTRPTQLQQIRTGHKK